MLEKLDFFQGFFVISLRFDLEVKGHMGQGQRSKVTWVKVKWGFQTKAGGLTTTSSCFIYKFYTLLVDYLFWHLYLIRCGRSHDDYREMWATISWLCTLFILQGSSLQTAGKPKLQNIGITRGPMHCTKMFLKDKKLMSMYFVWVWLVVKEWCIPKISFRSAKKKKKVKMTKKKNCVKRKIGPPSPAASDSMNTVSDFIFKRLCTLNCKTKSKVPPFYYSLHAIFK